MAHGLSNVGVFHGRDKTRTLVCMVEEKEEGDARTEPLPTFGDPDGEFLVDLSDREALWAALDADGCSDRPVSSIAVRRYVENRE